MTARASNLDLTKLPKALQPQGRPKPISAATREMLAETNRFEEGQISGPFGPKFAGFGEMPKPSLKQVAGEVIRYGLILSAGSLGLILLSGLL